MPDQDEYPPPVEELETVVDAISTAGSSPKLEPMQEMDRSSSVASSQTLVAPTTPPSRLTTPILQLSPITEMSPMNGKVNFQDTLTILERSYVQELAALDSESAAAATENLSVEDKLPAPEQSPTNGTMVSEDKVPMTSLESAAIIAEPTATSENLQAKDQLLALEQPYTKSSVQASEKSLAIQPTTNTLEPEAAPERLPVEEQPTVPEQPPVNDTIRVDEKIPVNTPEPNLGVSMLIAAMELIEDLLPAPEQTPIEGEVLAENKVPATNSWLETVVSEPESTSENLRIEDQSLVQPPATSILELKVVSAKTESTEMKPNVGSSTSLVLAVKKEPIALPPPLVRPLCAARNQQGRPCAATPRIPCPECMLVAYCGKICQEADWKHHKEVCQLVISHPRMEKSDIEELPSFDEDSFWASYGATDILNLEQNEGAWYDDELSILFPGGRGLRHLIYSVVTMPQTASPKFNVVLCETHPTVFSRTLFVLLLLLDETSDPVLNAEVALHLWYSAKMPRALYEHFRSLVGCAFEKVYADVEATYNKATASDHTRVAADWVNRRGNVRISVDVRRPFWMFAKSALDPPDHCERSQNNPDVGRPKC
ncbi:hypothetical protein PT974_05079 [Cladobotryum mycophilum]|uniref:MYND-type domain-containing protein n=1 Tax=Cladobotryum mycophilum TaxID=491253 RepID=A0ABR0SQZ6_9HYPO